MLTKILRHSHSHSQKYAPCSTLISVSKFVEGDPLAARELLSHLNVQTEAVSLNRLSDLWRLQHIARTPGGWETADVDPDGLTHVFDGFHWSQLKADVPEAS